MRQRGHAGLDGLRSCNDADVHGGRVGVIDDEDALGVSVEPRGVGARGESGGSERDAVGAERVGDGVSAGAGGDEGGDAIGGVLVEGGGKEGLAGVVDGLVGGGGGGHVAVPDVVELDEQLEGETRRTETFPMTRSIMRSRYSRGGTSEMPCLSRPRTKRFQNRSSRLRKVYFWR